MSDDQQSTTSSAAPPLTALQGLFRVGIVVSTLVILKWTMDFFRDDSPEALGLDEQVATRGTVEVTARLVKLPKEYPTDDKGPYASLFQYDVLKIHRGSTERQRIFVAHYNPTKPRAGAVDKTVRDVGGKLTEFRARARHRLALDVPLKEHYQGKVIDDFPKFKEKGPLYWAVWTNPVN